MIQPDSSRKDEESADRSSSDNHVENTCAKPTEKNANSYYQDENRKVSFAGQNFRCESLHLSKWENQLEGMTSDNFKVS